MSDKAFNPKAGATQTVSATTTSASVTVDADCPNVVITTVGSVAVHVRMGKGAQTATTSDFVVHGNATINLFKGWDVDTIAIRTASGTATVYVTPGTGGD